MLICKPGRVYIYRPQTKFTKVMFSQVSVCPKGGVCVADTPRTRPPRPDTNPWADSPGTRHPPWADPPRDDRSTSGRYASHWNSFFFFMCTIISACTRQNFVVISVGIILHHIGPKKIINGTRFCIVDLSAP